MKTKVVMAILAILVFAGVVLAQIIKPPVDDGGGAMKPGEKVDLTTKYGGLTKDEMQKALVSAEYNKMVGTYTKSINRAYMECMKNHDLDCMQVLSDCAQPYVPTTTTLP